MRNNRDVKIDVYGKRLTSDTLFAIKTISLTVKCFIYRIYSKKRKHRTETLRLTTVTWWLILNDFSAHVARRLIYAVWRLHFTIRRLTSSQRLEKIRKQIAFVGKHFCFPGSKFCFRNKYPEVGKKGNIGWKHNVSASMFHSLPSPRTLRTILLNPLPNFAFVP